MGERMRCEVLVVGAGPAGLAATVAASGEMFDVVLIDENPVVGGQIWRAMGGEQAPKAAGLFAHIFRARTKIFTPASCLDLLQDDVALVQTADAVVEVQFDKLILATGARELFLPFPGWTLPGVYGVGGLQALVKQGFSIRSKRLVVAGTGPLLLAVAKHLRKEGARLVSIPEQAPSGSVREVLLSLWRHPDKISQALSFYWTAQKIKPGWWVERAMGEGRVEAVQMTNGTSRKTVDCELLACSYGLIPNLELARLAGCEIENGFVKVDEDQRTSLDRVFAVGEIVEIGGAEAAIVQGTIAGLTATGKAERAKRLFGRREQCNRFSVDLERAYRLRPEVLRLAHPETVVCRCEDVRLKALAGATGFREAKLHTRLGMGPCQGRVCGAACRALFGWEAPGVRPPVVPVPLGSLAVVAEPESGEFID